MLYFFFRPLIGDVPLVGGLQVYFLNQPELDFDLGGAGNLLEIPGLNGLLKGAIDDQIARHLVVPNRISVVLSDQVSAESIRMPRPAGILSVRILEARYPGEYCILFALKGLLLAQR